MDKKIQLQLQDNGRAFIWWVDPETNDRTGPDSGVEHTGYTDDKLRARLIELETPEAHVEKLILEFARWRLTNGIKAT